VWVGEFDSQAEYEEYFKESSEGEGNAPLNKFASDFRIGSNEDTKGWYDPDFIEHNFSADIKTPEDMLGALYYASAFASKAAELASTRGIADCNTVVALYAHEVEYELYDKGTGSPLVFLGRFYIVDDECVEMTEVAPTVCSRSGIVLSTCTGPSCSHEA
ncbi:MAG: immunity 22 family protein, partial [Cyanobacteria bacterium]|nr:immunity 22 family protein [Cyanobacteriota bacterium]